MRFKPLTIRSKLKISTIPHKWQIPFFMILGITAGLICFLIYESNFFSYLSEKPKTCMNCHIMGPQYATWDHSSHREVTTCNKCHVPTDNPIRTYSFKAKDGMRHATIFTLRREPQAIIIKPEGSEVVQENCIRCHKELFHRLKVMKDNPIAEHNNQVRKCWFCHRSTPHGRVRSLSSAPFARVPTTESLVPAWLKRMMFSNNNH